MRSGLAGAGTARILGAVPHARGRRMPADARALRQERPVRCRRTCGRSMLPRVHYVQENQAEGVPPLELTGERTLPDVPEENYWYRRHVAVYEWIVERCDGLRVVDL